MGELDLWDSLNLQNKNLEKTANFAELGIALNNALTEEKFLLIFVDIKNSTSLLCKHKNISKIFEFFKIAADSYKRILEYFTFSKEKNTLFKFVGDGILFLTPFSSQNFKEKNSINQFVDINLLIIKFAIGLSSLVKKFITQELFENITQALKQNSNTLDFRVVGGIGTLYCINFKTQNGILKECIGCPISYLVKKSKCIDTYKWFGEITPEKCKEIL